MQLKTIQAFLQKKLEQKTRGIISIQAFLQKTGGIILFILRLVLIILTRQKLSP